ncbi:MAG: MSHA pilin protein MshD [Candidatus Azotimanducaceae bacterium]|jgi:MSHA pilin protein MshD
MLEPVYNFTKIGPPNKCQGVTLVELIVTIVIISISLVSLALTVSFSASHSADSMVQVKLVELAQAYTEEILMKRFDESSPSGGVPACFPAGSACGGLGDESETRSTFDDVDDYDGLDESPPLDSLGNTRENYIGYRVQVAVTYMDAIQITAYGLDTSSDAKLIEMSISPPSGSTINFAFFKGNY